MKFVYGSSFQVSIQMVLYKALYERKCKSPLFWDNVSELDIFRLELIQKLKDKRLTFNYLESTEELCKQL